MTTQTKIWLIIAACLLLVGAVLFVCTMTKLGWDLTKLSSRKFQSVTHNITDPFGSISIDANTTDILILPSTDGTCQVVCQEYEKESHSVAVVDGTLTLRAEDTRKWYDHIVFFQFDIPKIILYLPQAEYETLQIKLSTGDINLANGLLFSNISIKTSTGDVECCASATGNITITTSTGDIDVENISASDLTLSVTTGETELRNITCQNLSSTGNTGELEMENVVASGKFTITRTTGDIELRSCDAGEITIEASTGDVTGTLRSSKIFIATASTGRVSVPETTTGGICKITTSTGNIRITIQ